jgi:hypothetical protein
MKKVMLFLIASLLIGGCMKNYEDAPLPSSEVPDGAFLKVTGATLMGDTAYAAPNIQLKFWLDSLPGSAESYSFNWNLGDGTTSVAHSPEHMYHVGTYEVSVVITRLSNGQTFSRSIVLIVTNNSTFETTVILLESTPVTGGNYNYKLALKSTVIYNYQNITGNRWIIGDFTGWSMQTITELITINQIEYLIYHLVLPANEVEVKRFSYGRGASWAYAPNSLYWVVSSQGEGAFEAYFTNGQMSVFPILSDELPGDGGDINQNGIPATTRNKIIGDDLRVFINYGVYANGANPFITKMNGYNAWNPFSLTPIGNGWGYKDFEISSLSEGFLFWRFGPNINNPNNLGNMSNSKFFMPEDNMLGLQIVQLKSGDWQIKLIQ